MNLVIELPRLGKKSGWQTGGRQPNKNQIATDIPMRWSHCP
jgi:hypothetical protein